VAHALAGELVPDAVNVQGGTIAEDVRPGIPLAERLGRIFTALAGGVAAQLDIEVRGEITQHDVKVLELAALKGVFTDVVESATVSYVNAPLLAAERGVEVRLTTSSESPDWRNLVTVRGTLASGQPVSVSGTLSGPRHIEKLVALDGFDIELEPTDHMMFLKYEDRPGVVGIVGRHLGDAGVNIAGMQVSRVTRGGLALLGMTVDSAIPPAVAAAVIAEVGAEYGRTVDLS
jgi:D-3-phosphoglycerate dehydrogenase